MKHDFYLVCCWMANPGTCAHTLARWIHGLWCLIIEWSILRRMLVVYINECQCRELDGHDHYISFHIHFHTYPYNRVHSLPITNILWGVFSVSDAVFPPGTGLHCEQWDLLSSRYGCSLSIPLLPNQIWRLPARDTASSRVPHRRQIASWKVRKRETL